MVGRSLGRLLVALGLLCASLAWSCWMVLHTVADPTRSSRVAHAVLDDPEARGVVAADLTASLAAAVNRTSSAAGAKAGVAAPKLDPADPRVRGAVDAALADPRVTANLVDAFAAEHANLLGVEPRRPATIDTGLLVSTVARAVGVGDPALAARLVEAAPGQIPLPDVEIPFVARLRGFATAAVPRLSVLAVLLCGAALLVGDRPGVLRRMGFWGIGAGLLWAVGPRVLVWLVARVAPGQAAVVRAVLQGATGDITAVATLLALGGAGLVALGFVASLHPGSRLVGLGGPGPRDGDADGSRQRVPGPPRVARTRHWTHPGRRDDSWSAGWRSFTGPELPRDHTPRPPGTRVDRRL